MGAGIPAYIRQDSPQSLREAIVEYYDCNAECNASLLDPDGLPSGVEELFRCHDAGHVVFGCDTTLRGETLIDTWTIFGSTAGIRGYLEYFNYPQVNQIFADAGYMQILLAFLRCFPDVFRVLARSRKMASRWPWRDYGQYLDTSLCDLREQFNIQVI